MANVTAALARGRRRAFAGAALGLALGVVWFEFNPRFEVAGVHTLAILVAGLPLGWLLVWSKNRNPRASFFVSLQLIVLQVAIYFFTFTITFLIYIPFLIILALFGISTDYTQSTQSLNGGVWCGLVGSVVGALLGASTSAKTPEELALAGDTGNGPRQIGRRGMVLGGLLGFVCSWVLCEVMYLSRVAILKSEAWWKVVNFVISIVEPLIVLMMILGFAVAATERSSRQSGS
jgi:hypothetical protein